MTSLDISEKQLEHSSTIAGKHKWNIDFICDDAMSMAKIESNRFDLVYISNGVMSWIDDLQAMYRTIHRVLKTNGHYIMYDRHPFMSPFEDTVTALSIKKDYDCVGPFGNPSTYHWRLQDIVNSIAASGLFIEHIEEMHAEHGTYWVDEDKAASMPPHELAKLYDSKTNPLYALPQAISICAKKARLQ